MPGNGAIRSHKPQSSFSSRLVRIGNPISHPHGSCTVVLRSRCQYDTPAAQLVLCEGAALIFRDSEDIPVPYSSAVHFNAGPDGFYVLTLELSPQRMHSTSWRDEQGVVQLVQPDGSPGGAAVISNWGDSHLQRYEVHAPATWGTRDVEKLISEQLPGVSLWGVRPVLARITPMLCQAGVFQAVIQSKSRGGVPEGWSFGSGDGKRAGQVTIRMLPLPPLAVPLPAPPPGGPPSGATIGPAPASSTGADAPPPAGVAVPSPSQGEGSAPFPPHHPISVAAALPAPYMAAVRKEARLQVEQPWQTVGGRTQAATVRGVAPPGVWGRAAAAQPRANSQPLVA